MQMEKEVHVLNIEDVLPNRFQPRITFDEKAINELAESIKEHGVIQPIVVRKVADKYEIIAGERRYKASILAGKTSIPAIVTDLNDKDSAEIALIENVQRQNLTPIEEAVSYKKILDMGYLNQSELAEKLGKTQSTIANKLRLLNLTDEVQEALLHEKISERHARSLLRLPKEKQNDMLNNILTNRMTVRKTDEEIQKLLGTESKNLQSNEIKIESKKEEKEDDKMNNGTNFMGQFNIPDAPIINNTNQSTPGPVAPPVQPQAPFEQPMPAMEPTQPEIPTMANPSVQEPMNFGNLNMEMPTQTDVNPTTPFVQPIIEQPAPIIDPAVPNIAPTPEIPVEKPIMDMPQVETIDHAPATPENADTPISGRFFNMFDNDSETEEKSSTSAITGSPVPPVEVAEPNSNFGFNPFGNPAPDVSSPTTVSASPVQQPIPAQVETNINFNDEPIPMPQVPITNEMQKPSQPEAMNTFEPYQLNDQQEFTTSSFVEMGSFGNNRMEEPTLEPLMESDNQAPRADMKEVINVIRNCARQIEKMGYKVDSDELDFEDSYQVIFRVDKGE